MFWENLFSVSAVINIAALFYFVGFLVRDELLLRLLVLSGTSLYLVYYAFYPDGPLWNAFFTSAFLGLANLSVLAKIIFERTTLALTDDEKSLYECLAKLTPGQFRKIMKHATWKHVEETETICSQGQEADRLFYLLKGTSRLEKNDKTFTLQEKNFIGELSFILGGDYSASAHVDKGTCYVAWDSQALKKLMKKNDAMANAISAMFNTDIATKLAASYQ